MHVHMGNFRLLGNMHSGVAIKEFRFFIFYQANQGELKSSNLKQEIYNCHINGATLFYNLREI